MAHFAQLNENNIVVKVIVVDNSNCGGGDFPESEPIGQNFIQQLGFNGNWKQTSYNASFRRNYAGLESIYIEEADIFIPPAPGPLWTLDENYEWQPPLPDENV